MDDLPEWLEKPHIIIGAIVATFFLWVVAVQGRLHFGAQARRDRAIMAEVQRIRAQREALAVQQAQAQAVQQAQAQALARQSALLHDREALLKDFALRNAPAAWKTLQRLRAEVQLQREQLESLKADMQLFGIQVSTDENVRAFQAQLSELERQRDGVYEKLVEALLAERKAAAAIGRRGYERLRQRALEEGIRRAEEAQRGFQGSQVHGVPAQ